MCPPRPESLDEVTLEFMRSCGTRIMQAKNNHSSNDTTFSTAPPSSRVSVESRLCLPSGHKVASHFSTIDSSRASVYPIDALQPSHWRDSTGNIRIREQVASSAVDDSGRGEGPVEQYDSNMEGHWKLEKRCSQGPNGNPGMLFRDASGESRFVSDI